MTNELAFLIGYQFGAIPFGLSLMRAAGGPDIRSIGSGNIGATNVLRTGRKGLAAATLICDVLKGTLAVWWRRIMPAPKRRCRRGPVRSSAISFRSG